MAAVAFRAALDAVLLQLKSMGPDCHRFGPHAYHVVGRQEFVRLHPIDIDGLVRRLTGDWFRVRRQA